MGDMTADQQRVALTALRAYEIETEMYLRGFGPVTGHDGCCATARARNAQRAVERVLLEERLANTRAAIAALGGESG
jgi:hypothetical protein